MILETTLAGVLATPDPKTVTWLRHDVYEVRTDSDVLPPQTMPSIPAAQAFETDLESFGAPANGTGDDSAALVLALASLNAGQQTNSALRAQPIIRLKPNKTYRIAQSVPISTRNGLMIDASGATILCDVDGPALSFASCNYPKSKGGNWIVQRDTSNAEAFRFERCKFADFADMEISGDAAGNDALNRGFSIHAPAAGINDVSAYNVFRNMRINRLGTTYELRDDGALANEASRTLLNQFREIESQCANGPKYVGAVNNYYSGDMECSAAGVQLSLVDNANGVGSSENHFDVLYLAGSRTVSYGANSVANTFTDRHGANSQNQANSTGMSIFAAGDHGYVELNDIAMGGVTQLQPATTRSQSMGGASGINLLRYSNNFAQWDKTNATVAASVAADPFGGTAASLVTQTVAQGYISLDTAILGNAAKNHQYSGRVWVMSDVSTSISLNVEQWTGSAARTLWQRRIYLQAGIWTLATAGMVALDSGSSDRWRIKIYPSYVGGIELGSVHLYQAQIAKGYGQGHNDTDGAAEPRGPSDCVKGRDLFSAGGLYLGGVERSNSSVLVSAASTSPASGDYRVGDVVFNKAASGPVGWQCTNIAPLTWRTF